MASNVVVRRKTRQEEERPMSMADRLSMFGGTTGNSPSSNTGGGGRSFGGNNTGAPKRSWRDAPPQVKLSDDTEGGSTTAEDTSPVAGVSLRPNRVNRDASRNTVPPNMFSQKDVQQQGSQPSTPTTAADTGKAKLHMAMGGMMAAMEAEKRQKGIPDHPKTSENVPSGPKPATGFLGLVNTVAPKNPVKRAQSVAAPGSAGSKKAALLHWCQRMTEGHAHVEIKNFSSSWNNGMAFCALFHHFVPDQIPYDTLEPKNREFNFTLAFAEGEKAGVTALLDVEDMVDMKNPDWMSVMTYISLIYNHFNGIRVGGPRLPPMPGQE